MAKLEAPRYFTAKPLAGGRTGYYWEPSPKLRKAGWTRLALGSSLSDAIAAADARNAEVAAWQLGGARPAAIKAAPTRATMAALIQKYREERMDKAARERAVLGPLSAETVRQYEFAFRRISYWAEDGETRLADITEEAIADLKFVLFNTVDKKTGRVMAYRAIAVLSMLRTLLDFAVSKKMLEKSPWGDVEIPAPPKRARLIGPAAVAAIRAAARTATVNRPDVDLGILLGLWTLQREADILAWTRANWRPCIDMAEESRRVLAGPDGRVMGFRMRQQKTKTWIEVPATPELRAEVEAALAASAARDVSVTHLVADPDQPRGVPQWKFQRGFRAAVNHAIELATADGDDMLVEQLTGVQFRDLRRTGMCLLRELGLSIPYIANLSGHTIDETTKILETYMPADPRTAAAAVAMAVVRMGERAAIEKEKSA